MYYHEVSAAQPDTTVLALLYDAYFSLVDKAMQEVVRVAGLVPVYQSRNQEPRVDHSRSSSGSQNSISEFSSSTSSIQSHSRHGSFSTVGTDMSLHNRGKQDHELMGVNQRRSSSGSAEWRADLRADVDEGRRKGPSTEFQQPNVPRRR
ncbi:hypothetical protein SISSUDRAFT_1038741 [Sistotremastrum suecicum HHB10207 ss-3]|uniref:Uncharacterized protein n=1 Tax=Sistotremastrum suecicum HHB10207 ss-3 TaxID=1314776 RepID=A0A165WE33_9AGAM|nr:hypothetical protein SISSUDRAFT_1038741 [Sistotremastrum suecicum HHB10207 ss-3]